MKFTQLLTDRRQAILDNWIERIVAKFDQEIKDATQEFGRK